MSARTDDVPRVQLHTAGHSDGGHAVPAAQAVGEDEAPVDQEEGEVVPGRGVGLGHVEQEAVAVVGPDGEADVGVVPHGGDQVKRHPAVRPGEPGVTDPHVLLAELALSAQGTHALVACAPQVQDTGAALLALVAAPGTHIVQVAARAPGPGLATLARVRGPEVKTGAARATRRRVTHPLVTLLDIAASGGDRHQGLPSLVLEHEVKYAASEAGVQGEVVRQPRKVVGLVTPDEELPVDVEVGQLAGGEAGDVPEVVHLQPGPPPPAAEVD